MNHATTAGVGAMGVTRPALRYHGGKWMLAPWILSHFPEHNVYTEVFGGGASVLLRKKRSHTEIYNDLDSEIVNLFRVLREPEQSKELIRLISLTPFARDEFDESSEAVGDPIERARRSLVHNWMSQIHKPEGGATFKISSKRGHARDWKFFPESLALVCERFRGVVIENRPAMEVLMLYDSTDALHYVDPPYPLATRGGNLYRHEMSDEEHCDLARVLRRLTGRVIVSGYACELYDRELYPDWQRIARDTHADGARDRTEVLWISPNAITRPQLFALDA